MKRVHECQSFGLPFCLVRSGAIQKVLIGRWLEALFYQRLPEAEGCGNLEPDIRAWSPVPSHKAAGFPNVATY